MSTSAPVSPAISTTQREYRHTGQRSGNRLFSDLEARVFQLLRAGKSGAEIAAALGVDPRAIRAANARLRSKLGCDDTAELAHLAQHAEELLFGAAQPSH